MWPSSAVIAINSAEAISFLSWTMRMRRRKEILSCWSRRATGRPNLFLKIRLSFQKLILFFPLFFDLYLPSSPHSYYQAYFTSTTWKNQYNLNFILSLSLFLKFLTMFLNCSGRRAYLLTPILLPIESLVFNLAVIWFSLSMTKGFLFERGYILTLWLESVFSRYLVTSDCLSLKLWWSYLTLLWFWST